MLPHLLTDRFITVGYQSNALRLKVVKLVLTEHIFETVVLTGGTGGRAFPVYIKTMQ